MRKPSPSFILAVVLLFAAAYAVGWCQRGHDVDEEKALATQEEALRGFHEANQRRRIFHEESKAKEDSLVGVAKQSLIRAALSKVRADSLFTLLGTIVPDSGKHLVDAAREACDGAIGAERAAYGACELARLSAVARADSLSVELSEAVALADAGTQQWRRFFDLRRSEFITCGPGGYLAMRDAGLGVSCHLPLVRLSLPRLWPF